MKLRRRNLTLLEVLISFTLIVLCLFPLLSPHVSFYQTQRRLGDQIRMNLAVANWYASFYEELLKKERTFESLVSETPQPIPNLPQKAAYIITNEQEKKGKEQEVYLFKLTISTENKDEFIYYFVVTRKLNGQTSEDPKEKATLSNTD